MGSVEHCEEVEVVDSPTSLLSLQYEYLSSRSKKFIVISYEDSSSCCRSGL